MKTAAVLFAFFAVCAGIGAAIGAALHGVDGAILGVALGAAAGVFVLYVLDASRRAMDETYERRARAQIDDEQK